MGRQIQPVRWALAPAIFLALAVAPQAVAGGLTGVLPAAAGQVAAPASAVDATAAAQTTVAETADAVVAAVPTALDAAGAAVEPAAQTAQAAAAGAQVAAAQVADPQAEVRSLSAVIVRVRQAPVPAATPVAATPAMARGAAVKRVVAKRVVVKPAAKRLFAPQRPNTPRRTPEHRRQTVRPGTHPSAHVRHIARRRAGDRSATTTIDRTPVLVPLAPLAGSGDPAPAAPGAGGAAPVAAAPDPVRIPAIGGRTPLTATASLFRSLTLLLRLERPD